MKVVSEKIEIRSGERDESGERLEPEEQTAVESFVAPIEIALGDHPIHGRKIVAETNVAVQDATTALDLAERHMRRCELCAGFRRADWIALKKRLDNPSNHEGTRFVNAIRGYVLGQVDVLDVNVRTPDHNVEQYLGLLGICAPVTEEDREISIAQPDGTCSRFTPRDTDARRVASNVYDAILRAAQGD